MDFAFSGSVPAGGWLYMKVTFPGVFLDRLRSVIDIEFSRTGGQPFILIRSQKPSDSQSDPPVMPTPLSSGNDMIMTMGSTETKRHYVIDAYADPTSASVTAGVNYIAVFNMDYFVRSTCNFTIQISQSLAANSTPIINPSFMSIIMGVILSMFLCLVMSVCKRYGARWRAPAPAPHTRPAPPSPLPACSAVDVRGVRRLERMTPTLNPPPLALPAAGCSGGGGLRAGTGWTPPSAPTACPARPGRRRRPAGSTQRPCSPSQCWSSPTA